MGLRYKQDSYGDTKVTGSRRLLHECWIPQTDQGSFLPLHPTSTPRQAATQKQAQVGSEGISGCHTGCFNYCKGLCNSF